MISNTAMGGIEVLFGVLLLLIERSSAGWNKMELHRMDEKSVEWLSQDCFTMDFYRSFEWGSPHLFGGTWYVVAFRDSAVLIQKERDIKGWVNDHWKWPLEQFIKNIDRQGHSWSQRVKEAVVDLGEEEGSRLLDVIGGAIKQREVKMSRPTSISTPRPLLPSSLVN